MLRTEHGGNPLNIKNVLDFSANINFLGVPGKVREALILSADDIDKYPDPYCIELRKKIAEKTMTGTEKLVCGNGADDLIYRLVSAFRPKRALVCSPSFSEYSKALNESGCEVHEFFLVEENGFEVTADVLLQLTEDTDMFFLCSPNNPTGRSVCSDVLAAAAEVCGNKDIILVCDESFADFTDSNGIMPYMNENVVILRSMTKSYAIPGARLGYAVFGSAEKAERVARTGQFWSVSLPAQRAGEAALDEEEYLRKTLQCVVEERKFLYGGLVKYVEKVYPSDANFILFKAENDLDEKFLREGILIRSCANYSGLSEGFFRIAVRSRKENTILINALRRLRNG